MAKQLWIIERDHEGLKQELGLGHFEGRGWRGTLGDIAGRSFCQNKTFTTGGEGGMVTTNDEELAWNARRFRDHGYDVKKRIGLMELEQRLPYIHNMVG
jgi:dTDP-4-amino-4,6-dideoxygalactose transaminase